MSGYETEVLMDFLNIRPEDPAPVMSVFAKEAGAEAHFNGGKNNFVYVPGKREDRVLLVAHADTVWDRHYMKNIYGEEYAAALSEREHRPELKGNVVYQGGWKRWGLGADDRAGCAILWLLKDSGHSLLVTDGEEHGQIGACHLEYGYPDLFEELNGHNYMIQLDRRGGGDYKTYDIPVSDGFRRFVEENTGYADAGMDSCTDIVVLCSKIAGVNLSIGYRSEHHAEETINVDEWLHTFRLVKSMLEKDQPSFPL